MMLKRLPIFCLLLYVGTLTGQAQIPNGYYSGTGGLKGNSLKSQLHQIIDGHTEFPYTSSNTDTWDILKQTDEDSTNVSNVILIYSANSVNAAQEYNSGNGWNREHVWPQSLGNFNTNMGPGTDVHNLKPCNISLNSSRSNDEYDNGGSPVSGAPDTYSDSDSWEPREAVKGDLARIIFYMATRYNGDVNGEPSLTLYRGTNGTAGKFGNLDTLLKWHKNDPVSSFERNRNNVIYSYQNNRNPFIDSPQFAQCIWTSNCPNGNSGNGGNNLKGEPAESVKSLHRQVFKTVELTWNDATSGSTSPEYYLIKASPEGFNAISKPQDGQPVNDKRLIQNVPQGTGKAEFALKSGQTYYFKIFPYTNPNNPDYKVTGNVQQTTITVQ